MIDSCYGVQYFIAHLIPLWRTNLLFIERGILKWTRVSKLWQKQLNYCFVSVAYSLVSVENGLAYLLQNQKAADQVCWDSQICSVNKTENMKVHKNTIKVAKNGF